MSKAILCEQGGYHSLQADRMALFRTSNSREESFLTKKSCQGLFAPGHSREPVPAAGTYVGSVRAPLPRTATGKLFLAARESSLLHKTGSSYCGQGLIENWVAGNQKAIHQHPAHFLPSHHIADADGRPVAGIYALGNLRSLSQVQASKLDRISLGVPPVPAPCGRLPGTTGPG